MKNIPIKSSIFSFSIAFKVLQFFSIISGNIKFTKVVKPLVSFVSKRARFKSELHTSNLWRPIGL